MNQKDLNIWLLMTMIKHNGVGIDLKKAIIYFSKSTNVELPDHDKIIESFIIKLHYKFKITVLRNGNFYYIKSMYPTRRQELKNVSIEPLAWDSNLIWPDQVIFFPPSL